jgi:hypothetical protein
VEMPASVVVANDEAGRRVPEPINGRGYVDVNARGGES